MVFSGNIVYISPAFGAGVPGSNPGRPVASIIVQ